MHAARLVALGACLAGVIAGCHRAAMRQQERTAEVIGPPAHQQMTLYDRLGGADAIRDLVNGATDRALQDPNLNFRRTGTNREWASTPPAMDHFRSRMTDYLVSMTGGPAAYHGPTMLEVHHGMRITDREYDAFVVDFKDAMRSRGVDPTDGRELVRILEGLRGDIVEVR
jgi:hemoglobin